MVMGSGEVLAGEWRGVGGPGTGYPSSLLSHILLDAILAKLNDKIGSMLEGISDATERQAQEQIREELLKRRGDLGAKFGKMQDAGGQVSRGSCQARD